MKIIEMLAPWKRIRELEAECEYFGKRMEAEITEAQYWYMKAFQFKEELQKSNQRIAELEELLSNANAKIEVDSIDLLFRKGAEIHHNEELQKSNQRIAELARDVEIHKDNAAELEMCVAELKQQLAEALKNDKRGKDGRYTK